MTQISVNSAESDPMNKEWHVRVNIDLKCNNSFLHIAACSRPESSVLSNSSTDQSEPPRTDLFQNSNAYACNTLLQ